MFRERLKHLLNERELEPLPLEKSDWRIEARDATTAILGLHPTTLRAEMHKLGIVRPETKEPD